MQIPDYVSPIVAYRAWKWKPSGLTSLNGEVWNPGKPLAATCQIVSGRISLMHTASTIHHEAPEMHCMCGIYAAKSVGQLRRMGYGLLGIWGEVYLWGVVVEHNYGWRAQFAYPKSLIISHESSLLTKSHDDPLAATFNLFSRGDLSEDRTRSYLRTLTAYGTDIFMEDREEKLVPLWTKYSRFDMKNLERFSEAGRDVPSFAVRVTVLTEDPVRRDSLKKCVQETHLGPLVFSQVGLPTSASDAIIHRLKDQQSNVVLVDLDPKNPLPGIRAIELIRAAFSEITIVAVGNTRNLENIMAPIFAGADEYVDRNDKRGLASILARCILPLSRQRTRTSITPPGGSTPPNGPPPPPAVLVLSPETWPRMPPRGAAAWAV